MSKRDEWQKNRDARRMVVRDSRAVLNGDKETFTPPSGAIEILNNDGEALFEISVVDGVGIEVRATGFVRTQGGYLTERITVVPKVRNSIEVFRLPEKPHD